MRQQEIEIYNEIFKKDLVYKYLVSKIVEDDLSVDCDGGDYSGW